MEVVRWTPTGEREKKPDLYELVCIIELVETFMKENTIVILPMAAFCKKSTSLAGPKYRNHN